MATTAEKSAIVDPSEGRIILHDVAWGEYEKTLEVVGERRMHVTYSDGTMEVRVPSQRHEQATQLLGLFIPTLGDELAIDYEPLGMTTWRRPDIEKGLEADQCYYIRNDAIVRERDELDLEIDPPPDLAIEVEITSSAMNRMEIYAELKVPEVWRYDGQRLTMYQLQPDGRYRSCEASLSFPGVRPADVERFLELGRTTPKRQWTRAVRDWIRDELIPRRNESKSAQSE